MAILYHPTVDFVSSRVWPRELLPILRDQTRPDRKPYKPGKIADAQPLHDRATVGLHCFRAEAKPAGHLFRRVSLGDQAKDLPLAQR